MKTAKEIWDAEELLRRTTLGGSLEDHIRRAINKGREEALKEAAKRAKKLVNYFENDPLQTAILNIIKEVK